MPQNREVTNIPWIIGDDEVDSPADIAMGGRVVRYKAGGTLNVGDSVCISAPGTVNKTVTTAEHFKRVGIVVGGQAISPGIRGVIARQNDVGVQAALVNQWVLVVCTGVYWAVAQAAIAAAAYVRPDTTTAGRVLTATTVADAGKILGLAIDAAAIAGDKIRIQLALQ